MVHSLTSERKASFSVHFQIFSNENSQYPQGKKLTITERLNGIELQGFELADPLNLVDVFVYGSAGDSAQLVVVGVLTPPDRDHDEEHS